MSCEVTRKEGGDIFLERPDYYGLSKQESKMIVQKENRLISLASSKLGLNEFKILDAFLSRIDSHEPNKTHVRFDRGDLEIILNTKRIHFDRLQKTVRGLFDDIKIVDETKPGGYAVISLFEETNAFRDEDGIWTLDLICTDLAAEYFFNVEKFGYIKYMLSNISVLSGRASYLMYLLLEAERNKAVNYGKKVDIVIRKSIDDLKVYLNCDEKACYEDFKHFNYQVLKKCHKELNEKTTLKYDYKPVNKRGKFYKDIEFTVHISEENLKIAEKTDRGGEPKKTAPKPVSNIDCRDIIFRVFIDLDLTMKQVNALDALIRSAGLSDEGEAETLLKNALYKYLEQQGKQEIESPYSYIFAVLRGQIEEKETVRDFSAMTEEERRADFERRLELMKQDKTPV